MNKNSGPWARLAKDESAVDGDFEFSELSHPLFFSLFLVVDFVEEETHDILWAIGLRLENMLAYGPKQPVRARQGAVLRTGRVDTKRRTPDRSISAIRKPNSPGAFFVPLLLRDEERLVLMPILLADRFVIVQIQIRSDEVKRRRVVLPQVESMRTWTSAGIYACFGTSSCHGRCAVA